MIIASICKVFIVHGTSMTIRPYNNNYRTWDNVIALFRCYNIIESINVIFHEVMDTTRLG